jgi:SAM-dependent methyltransferase
MAATQLPSGEADFIVMSLSMWGTPADRLAYLCEAKRLLRPLGKLIIVEPAGPFGGPEAWRAGAERLHQVIAQLGMRLAVASEHSVERGTSLVTFIIDSSSTPPQTNVTDDTCDWLA